MRLIDQILEKTHTENWFTDLQLALIFPNLSPAARYNQVKRAFKRGELEPVRRGLYLLGPRYRRRDMNLFELAQAVYGPSYISFESALSFHNLIPEAVYSVASATVRRPRKFGTPVGYFFYERVPEQSFQVGVQRVSCGRGHALIATPLKALADYVYARKINWIGLDPLIDSLRIEPDEMKWTDEEFEDLINTYPSARVTQFLRSIHKELK